MRALAAAARCFCPPETSQGYLFSSLVMPNSSARGSKRALISEKGSFASTRGRRILSPREKVSSRLQSWKTKPRWSRRKAESLRPGIFARFFPSSNTSPAVGRSREASRFKRVLFPLPLSPMMATNSPSSTVKETLRKAAVRFPPLAE